MENDLISRSALLENIKRCYCADCNSHNGVWCSACGTGDALDMIEDAPAVDAVVLPRKMPNFWLLCGMSCLPSQQMETVIRASEADG